MLIVKPGVRPMNEKYISNDFQDDSFNVKQMISSQDEAIYDILMWEFKRSLVGLKKFSLIMIFLIGI